VRSALAARSGSLSLGIFSLLGLVAAPPASACGVSPPLGPTGLPQQCDGTVTETPWSAGVTVSAFSTTIDFGELRAGLVEESAVASLGYHFGPRWGLSGTLGAILDGRATVAGIERDVGAGPIVSLSGNWLAVYEGARRPFLLASATLGVSTVTAVSDDDQRHRLTSSDLRLAAVAGKTFGRLVPVVAARLFGGPVAWRLGGSSVWGGDTHHYAVGAGMIARLPARLNLFVEVMPLGEQSATTGLTLDY
jgi:hypothetical protein